MRTPAYHLLRTLSGEQGVLARLNITVSCEQAALEFVFVLFFRMRLRTFKFVEFLKNESDILEQKFYWHKYNPTKFILNAFFQSALHINCIPTKMSLQ